MKLKNLILAAVAALCVAIPASVDAQGFGADVYGAYRTVVIANTGVKSGAAVGNVTNNPIDLRDFCGIGKIDILVVTNSGGGVLTASLETSPDLTNWTAIANYANSTSATQISTNTFYGSVLLATNTIMFPGVITTPTAATAGFATPYLAPAPFTNTGAITVSAGGVFSIGLNVADQPRYMHMIWTPTGSVTNFGAFAILTAKRQQ